jgi:hypothetical protein
METRVALCGIILIVLVAIVVGGWVKIDYTNIALTGIAGLGGYLGNEVKHALTDKVPDKPTIS